MNTNTIINRPIVAVHLTWECADPDTGFHSRIILIGLHAHKQIAGMDYATIESMFDNSDDSDDMEVSLQAFTPQKPKPVQELMDVMKEAYAPDSIDFYDDIVEFVSKEMPCECGCEGVEMPERDAAIAALATEDVTA